MTLQREAFRRRRNYAAALVTELVASPMRVAARAAAGTPTDPATWRRGLILSHTHLGDVLYRTCSLDVLHRHIENCSWSFLVTPQSAEVLRGNSAIDEVLPLLDDQTGRLDDQARRELRERRFDVALCTNTFAIGRDLYQSIQLRIPNRVAFAFKGFSGLVTHPIIPRFPSPYPAYFQQMVAQLTGRTPDWPLRPVVVPDVADEIAADGALRFLALPDERPIVCAPGTRQRIGAVPLPVFARVVREVTKRISNPVILCGAADEREKLTQIADIAGIERRIIAGSLNVRALVVLFGRAAVAITQDSGPRHLANAAGVPVAFFRNLAVPRLETGRYCESEIDVAPMEELLTAESATAVFESLDPADVATAIADHASHASARTPRAEPTVAR